MDDAEIDERLARFARVLIAHALQVQADIEEVEDLVTKGRRRGRYTRR